MARPALALPKILDAAERVLLERAAASFTLDAVAAAAGVSKGGLMYHFPTKDALLEALVARAVDRVDRALAAAAASGEPGAFTRAFLDVSVPVDVPAIVPGSTCQVPADTGVTAALAAAVAVDPRLLDPLRAAYARWQRRIENDGLDVARATTVRFAVDGWWLAGLIGLPPLDPQVHRATRALLEELAAPQARASH